jgi:hypothetical protein
MSHSNTIQIQSAEVFEDSKSSTWERLTKQVSRDVFCEFVFIAVTSGLITFLAYTFYHGLQNYQVF